MSTGLSSSSGTSSQPSSEAKGVELGFVDPHNDLRYRRGADRTVRILMTRAIGS